MRSEDEVRALLENDFAEKISDSHDYSAGDLERVFWLGYRIGVDDGSTEALKSRDWP